MSETADLQASAVFGIDAPRVDGLRYVYARSDVRGSLPAAAAVGHQGGPK